MSSSMKRLLVIGSTVGMLAGALTSANAVAEEPGGVAAGSVGAVDAVVDGEPVRQSPIAPCDVDGEQDNDSGRVTVGDVATFWGGQSGCHRSDAEEAEAVVEGRYFVTDVLREWGGPRIKVSAFDLSCETQDNGSGGHVELRGVRGITLPEEIPPNYTVTIPGRIPTAVPLAKVIVNEFTTPSPPDGSMQMHALRIVLFPEGGAPLSGDITLGTVTCDPYGG